MKSNIALVTSRRRKIRNAVSKAILMGILFTGMGIIQRAAADDTLDKVHKQGYVDIAIGVGGMPYGGLGPDGQAIGAAPEITIAVLKKMGISEVHPKVVDWGALIPGLLAQRFDIVTTGMFITPKRCDAVLFSNPDTCSRQAFMVPKGNPLNLHTYKDIAANSAVLVTMAPGSQQAGLAHDAGVPADRIVVAPDVQSRLKLMQTGRVNAWADPSDTFAAPEAKDPNFEIVVVTGLPVSCAGAAFRPADGSFRDAYNAALEQIRQSGEFDAILTKYGFPADVPKQTTREQLCGKPN